MRNAIIIGTSGHIDHGKTALVEMLTGENGDRLPEEKKRGMTIDLGFTNWKIDADKVVAFIDVPGHEKFIKSMVSGAAGIDAVLLVVAADEGVMPQTDEHFQILKHLPVTFGAVVVTKCDLAEADQILHTDAAIQELVKNSFLEGSPIFHSRIDAPEMIKTALKSFFLNLMQDLPERDSQAVSRFYADRVFSVKGHGRVVTGTLLEGDLCTGDTVFVYNGETEFQAKARNVQVHGADVQCAHAGQRVAVNLSEGSVARGSLIASAPVFEPSVTLDVWIEIDKGQLRHWQRLRLHHGTSEILCRLAAKNKAAIESGKRTLAQLRLEKPIYAKVNDAFVLRSFSPIETLGGGRIINPMAIRGKWADAHSHDSELIQVVRHLPQPFEKEFLMSRLSLDASQAEIAWVHAVNQGEILSAGAPFFCTASWHQEKKQLILDEISEYHLIFPLRFGIPMETLRSKSGIASKVIFRNFVEKYTRNGQFKIKDNEVALANREIIYTREQERLKAHILQAVHTAGGVPLPNKDLMESHSDKKAFWEMLYHLINIEILVKINGETVMDAAHYVACREALVRMISDHGAVTVAAFRDAMGISRKNSVILLEHFDAVQLTKRIDNKRILLNLNLS